MSEETKAGLACLLTPVVLLVLVPFFAAYAHALWFVAQFGWSP